MKTLDGKFLIRKAIFRKATSHRIEQIEKLKEKVNVRQIKFR